MRTDYQVHQHVIHQLKCYSSLNSAQIGVAVKNGIVTLSGFVENYYKKTVAENAVKKISGVKAVAEDLQVGISPLNKKTDTEIAESVLNAIKLHVSVPEEKIKIRVEDGIVTLEGEVDWNFQRRIAQELLSGLSGVRSIVNNISVKPLVTPDSVKQRISAAFVRQASIDAAKIFMKILKGSGSWSQNAVVLANAAMALQCTGGYSTYDDAYAAAVESLESGRAHQQFEKLISLQ